MDLRDVVIAGIVAGLLMCLLAWKLMNIVNFAIYPGGL
jgi:hypothetical protein